MKKKINLKEYNERISTLENAAEACRVLNTRDYLQPLTRKLSMKRKYQWIIGKKDRVGVCC